jgi:hypothetical protein
MWNFVVVCKKAQLAWISNCENKWGRFCQFLARLLAAGIAVWTKCCKQLVETLI